MAKRSLQFAEVVLKHQSIKYLVVCLFFSVVAFALGDFRGRMVARANNLLFSMALHLGATLEFDKIPCDAFPEKAFCRSFQAGFLSSTIKEIDEIGLSTILNESSIGDESFLKALYRKAKTVLQEGTCDRDENL